MESFDADYIMCSNLKEGSQAEKATMDILNAKNIYVNHIKEETTLITAEGASFISSVVSECDSCPKGDILCVGYGAGKADTKTVPNLVRALITATEENIEFASLFRELKI